MSALPSFGVVIATRNRPEPLRQTLESIAMQEVLPDRVIVADRSDGADTRDLCGQLEERLPFPLVYLACEQRGAAAQRDEGTALVAEDLVVFMDDDIELRPGCLWHLVTPFARDTEGRIGAVGPIIENTQYGNPSRITRRFYRFLDGGRDRELAGKVIGPALNLMHAPDPGRDLVPVDWVPTGCTAYRREAYEANRFPAFFTGYSLAEDVWLSMSIGKQWELYSASKAVIYHYEVGGPSTNYYARGKMAVLNRYVLMTQLLHRTSLGDHFRFLCLVFWHLLVQVRGLRRGNVRGILLQIAGNFAALGRIAVRAVPVAESPPPRRTGLAPCGLAAPGHNQDSPHREEECRSEGA